LILFLLLKLKKSIPESIFPGHTVFDTPGVKVNDNVHGRLSGGVGFLVRKSLCKFVQRIEIEFDNIVVLKIAKEFLGTMSDCILLGLYLPPENSAFYEETEIYNGVSLLEDCLLEVTSQYRDCHVIVCGDLNARTGSLQASSTDPIDNIYEMTDKNDDNSIIDDSILRFSDDRTINSFGRLLLSVCDEFDLCILNGIQAKGFSEKFTYNAHNGSSVLDYFIVSRALLPACLNFEVQPVIESKHCLIKLSLAVANNTVPGSNKDTKREKISKFKWSDEKKEAFIEAMQSDAVKTKLTNATNLVATDINQALSEFNECLTLAGDSMKVTFTTGKEKLKIWFDLECKESRRTLRKQLRKLHSTHGDEDRASYAEKRRQYKDLLRNKKRLHKAKILDDLEKCFKDPKKFWDTLRSYRRKSSADPNSIDRDKWYNHFKNVFNSDELQANRDTDFPNDNNENIDCDSLNAEITPDEVRAAIKALKSKKAPGPDGLIGEFFKNSCEQILPFLVALFNHLFEHGLFPDNWSLSILQPLHKKGDPSIPDNYRGISLLDISSKLYSFVLNRRITSWIEENNIIGEEQAGFRENYSTIDHIFTLVAMIQKQLVRHRKLYVAFIDFRKAFDSVARDKLWRVLNKTGMNGKIVQALQSMYRVVRARVRAGADLTEEFLCPLGVKQGEVCSPVLFSLFINELTKDIVNRGRHGIQLSPDLIELFILLFADDVILFSDTVVGLQTQLNILCESAKRLGLIVNLDKSNVVVFRNGGYLGQRENWFFDGKQLSVVNMYKYLGIYMSTRLTFSHTFKDLADRARKGVSAIMKMLWTLGEFSPAIFFKLFDCQIQPILTYGSEVWGLFEDQECIERVHLTALKRFLGVSYRTPRHFVYGETGRHPLYVVTYSRCVKFWLRLTSMEDHRYPKKAYNSLLFLQRQNYTTWACKVRNVLYRFGFGIVWEAQGVGNVKAFMLEFKTRLIDCFKQDWSSALANHDFYYTFSLFKREVVCAQYLSLVRNIAVRRLFTRLRFGMSPLRGHYVEFRQDRMIMTDCPFCVNTRETEVHFLLACPEYRDLRDDFIPPKYTRQPSLFKLVMLMSSSSETLLRNLANFVYKALAKRGHVHG
jgi:hypothetical protein